MAETNSANDTTKTAKKAKKKKGPIRYEAIIPFTIFVLIVWAYFFFFFDTHLRHAIEHFGTNANGAEVNVGSLKTSFWQASLDIDEIQITDAQAPQKNKIQIGKVRWNMNWDALLRGKVAIEDASILEIAIGVTRKKPGRVLPPDPPGTQSAFDKVRTAALNKAKAEFSQNVLGDAAAILGGVDPKDQLKNIEGTIKSVVRVKELEAELKKKEAEWKERIAKLPQKKDIDSIQERLKKVQLDRFENVGQLQASLKEIDSIYKDADAKVKAVEETAKAVKGDTNTYKNTLGDLEKMVRQDIKDLESRLKIPKLDAASLAKQTFGPLFLAKFQQAEIYMNKAREYMPPKKTAEEKAEYAPPTPRERESGRNYKFGRPRSYPLFWLKHAAISSKPTPTAEYSGDIKGTLENVTDDQPVLGLPTVATFEGNFPAQELMGLLGRVTLDHRTDVPLDRLELKVGSAPMVGQMLVDEKDVKLGFEKAVVGGDFLAELHGKEVKVAAGAMFSRAKAGDIPTDPKIIPAAKPIATPVPGATPNGPSGAELAAAAGGADSAGAPSTAGAAGAAPSATPAKTGFAALKNANQLFGDEAAMAAKRSTGFLSAQAASPALNDLLNSALSDIPKVSLNASVAGPWSDLKFSIRSSLGDDLASAFDRQLRAKLAEARARVEAMVNQEIAVQKAKLEAEFAKVRAQVEGEIGVKQAELAVAKSKLETAKNDATNAQKKKLEGEAKKGLDSLKKKFKF